MCFVHVLFHHVAKRPNGRLAQVLGTPVKFPSDSRAIAIPWHRSSSSQKALWCRGALRVGGVRWAVEVFLGLSLKLLFCNPFLTSPKPDLLQLSLPQPGHQHLLHCALRLGSFGTSWITCTSLIPWATSCSPKTAVLFAYLALVDHVNIVTQMRSTSCLHVSYYFRALQMAQILSRLANDRCFVERSTEPIRMPRVP